MAKLLTMNQKVDEMIKLAKASNHQAQLALYDMYSQKMLGVCSQFIKDLQFAEDVMIIAFHKALTNINSFEPYGSFEGWLRRIMVRECISYLRIQKNKFDVIEITDYHFIHHFNDAFNDESSKKILDALDELPIGCKTVFNLYCIEGYKHYEIAELLQITIGTSKSQLAHARKLLQQKLSILNLRNYGNE